tara:strand:+ start:28 stop:3006 length:2979 start_codon:yes stop_codon:yes gene_type:complete
MRKKILITSLVIFLIILFSIAYLSFYGIKTDNFNNFINSKVKEYNSRLTLKLVDVFIKLNLSQGSININTKDTFLITENDSLEISNLDININILKFFKKENSIKNIKIESAENSIKDVTSLLNSIDYDLSRYVFYSQVKKGLVKFKLDAEFHIHKQNVYSYQVSGFVKDAKINLVGNGSLDNINFNFDKNDKLTKISNLNFSYQNLNLLSETIEIKNEDSGEYIIDGDIKTDKALISPNLLFSLANIKQNYLSDKNISLDSKNIFSFKFNKNKKIKNIKISSVINFDEVYLNKKYQNLIFLKQGRINSKYENEQLNAELISNFGFSDNLKLNTDFKKNNLKLSLKSKNNQKIYIKGKLSHEKTLLDPKIFLNLFQLDPNLLSNENINVETDNQFEFEVYNNKLKNYLVNSEINIEKLEFNKQIQDLLYLKNIKTKLTFGEKLLNLNLNSNYSFLDKSFNNESDKNIFNLKLNKNDTKFSDLEIFLKADNNKINTKEIKKYLNLKDKNNLIGDQIINIDSNFIINATVDNLLNIKKFAIRSDLNFDNLNINYKSSLVKKYLKNFNNKFVIKNSNILFDYSNDLANLQLDGKYSLNDQEDSIFLNFTGNKNTFELYSLLNLDNSILNISEIQYYKKKNIPSKLEILIKKSKKFSNLEKIILTDRTNYISLKNLNISDKFKMTSVDEIDVNFYNKNKILNNFKIKKNSNNYQFIGRQIDGEKLVDRLLKGNSKNKISNFFDNMTTTILFKLNKIYLEKNSYLEKFAGKVDIKNNKLSSAKFDAILDKNNEFSYSHRTTLKNEKITNIFIKEPKSFINNYKFIKGFEEGELKLNSTKIDNVSRSNLRINNFKVKEVPVLAKILTLASLQGIADLLTGEGIRFNKFEMDFKTKNNLIEIDEMYAIGPAISIIMEGYIEKDRITSLRGTLVPATTINKKIAKIPLLGNILVGGKTGEGVFGVSFKIKGPPSDLKSTVNPIKTLTPRFITRILENLKGS